MSSPRDKKESEDSIQVAVRVRKIIPKLDGADCVQQIFRCEGGRIYIQDPHGNEKPFDYNFAYDPSNCTQERVWKDLGESVLQAAWDGYNR
jgi:hypothetical protein